MSTHVLDVTLTVDSPETARAVAQSLSVEARDAPPGTRVQVHARDAEIQLHFEAEETRGLRAAAHSFLRWADVAIGAAQAVGR